MKAAVLREFFEFIFARKKYWMIPVIIILLLIGILLVVSESSFIAPFIYTLF